MNSEYVDQLLERIHCNMYDVDLGDEMRMTITDVSHPDHPSAQAVITDGVMRLTSGDVTSELRLTGNVDRDLYVITAGVNDVITLARDHTYMERLNR